MQAGHHVVNNYGNCHKTNNHGKDVGHLTGGGFMGHLSGSHDNLEGPIQSKDAIDTRV
jgi:hypothetical protein